MGRTPMGIIFECQACCNYRVKMLMSPTILAMKYDRETDMNATHYLLMAYELYRFLFALSILSSEFSDALPNTMNECACVHSKFRRQTSTTSKLTRHFLICGILSGFIHLHIENT